MKKFLLHILFTVFCFVYALTLSAQNLGIATPGATNYPATNVGNNVATNNNLNVANNFLVADQYTTSVPLTAIQIISSGSGGGNVKVSIYSNAAGNAPGIKLCPEVQVNGVSTSASTTYDISDIFLPAGTYWIVFNCSISKGVGQTNTTGIPRRFVAQSFATAFQTDMSALGWSAPGGNADATYFVGVQIEGYAKATKAILPATTAFTSVSFYTHAAGNARLAIYSDNGSGTTPSTKQWESADITINATGQPKLTTVNINSGTPAILTLNAGTYWLVWQWSAATNGPSYTAGASNTGNFIVQPYGAFPASWTGGTASTENWTIFATFCAQPVASVTGQTNITCFAGNDGTITVSASGGTGGYTFSVDNGANYLPPTGTNERLFTGLAPGNPYKIRVKDNIGCESKSVQ